MCGDITPCADCPWTLLILTGQPVFIMYCERCRHWYQAAEVVVDDGSRGYEVRGYDVLAYGKKEHVTSLLHCDALASKIFIQKRRYCGHCDTLSRGSRMFYSNPANLAAIIRNLTESSYKNSNFPAYTFLHRCGAHQPFVDAILKVRPDLREKVQKHLNKRVMDQQRFLKKIVPLIASQQEEKKRGPK